MKRRLISCLLVIGIIISLVPFSVFAEMTPADVSTAIEQAQDSAGDAAVAGLAAGAVTSAADEAIAAVNEAMAAGKLEDAVDVVESANAEITEQKQEAQEAQQDAEAAGAEADNQLTAAEGAADAAEAELENAQNAANKQEATQAADNAQEQSNAAASAAAEAAVQSQTAAQKAEDAKAAYEAANAAAEAADAEAKALLAEGLISAEEAAKRTEEAAKEANALYEKMCAAQTAAEEAAAAAKKEADAAKEELKAASEELAKVTAENAQNVVEKGAAAAVTGAALEVSKIAVDKAQEVVDSYESDIAELEEQAAELQGVIDEAQAAIDEAQAKLDALDAEDAAYPQAVAALEAAKAAKEEAEKVRDNAQAIIDARKEAEANGQKKDMTDLQGKVSSGDATPEEKQKLTEMVLGSIHDYDEDVSFGEIQWDKDNDNIFYVEDDAGNKTYYEVKTVERDDGTSYLQYFKTTRNEETQNAKNFPEPEELYTSGKNPGTEATIYKAYDRNGNEYTVDVVCKRHEVWVPIVGTQVTYSYEYQVNGNLMFAVGKNFFVNGREVTVQLITFDTEDAAIGTNSNSITDKWAVADNAEQNLADATQKLEAAEKTHSEAEKVYNAATDELNTLIQDNEDIKLANQPQLDNLNAQITQLDQELNGGVGDQLLRALIEGDTQAGMDAAKKIAALEWKALIGNLTEEEQKELDSLKASLGTSKEIANVVAGVSDGKLDLDDIKNIINLLGDDTVSAKTRLAIAKAVESALQKAYDKAAQDLQDAIDQAKAEIKAQGDAVAEATKNFAQKEAALAAAALKESIASQAADRAEKFNAMAKQAAKDAEDAYHAYKWLVDSYATDKQAVADAQAAYENALKLAEAAAKAAEDAAAEAARAKAAAAEARAIADAFPVPQEETKPASVKMSIAEFAYRLKGISPADFLAKAGENPTSASFVEYVFACYGFQIDLSSNKVEDIEKNFTCLAKGDVKPGDIICILAADGVTVECFGVYYGNGIYTFFNEATGKVETAKCADAVNGWFVIRVA